MNRKMDIISLFLLTLLLLSSNTVNSSQLTVEQGLDTNALDILGQISAPIAELDIQDANTSYTYTDGTQVITGIVDGILTQIVIPDNTSTVINMHTLPDGTMVYEEMLITNDGNRRINYLRTWQNITQLPDGRNLFSLYIGALLNQGDPYSDERVVVSFKSNYTISPANASIEDGIVYMELGVWTGNVYKLVTTPSLPEIPDIPGMKMLYTWDEFPRLGKTVHEFGIRPAMMKEGTCSADPWSSSFPDCFTYSLITSIAEFDQDGSRNHTMSHDLDILDGGSPKTNATIGLNNSIYESLARVNYQTEEDKKVLFINDFVQVDPPGWHLNMTRLYNMVISNSKRMVDRPSGSPHMYITDLVMDSTGVELSYMTGNGEHSIVNMDFLTRQLDLIYLNSSGSVIFDSKSGLVPLNFLVQNTMDVQLGEIFIGTLDILPNDTSTQLIIDAIEKIRDDDDTDSLRITDFGVFPGGTYQSIAQISMFLQLENAMQQQSRLYQMISNAMRARHDTAMASIRNVRALQPNSNLDQLPDFKIFDFIIPEDDYKPMNFPIYLSDEYGVSDPHGKDIFPIPTPTPYLKPQLNVFLEDYELTSDTLSLNLNITDERDAQVDNIKMQVFADGVSYSNLSMSRTGLYEVTFPLDFEDYVELEIISPLLPLARLHLSKRQLEEGILARIPTTLLQNYTEYETYTDQLSLQIPIISTLMIMAVMVIRRRSVFRF